MSSGLHSELGASSCHRWSQCPGSIRESRGIEPINSVYAEEGTVAHDLASKWLETDEKPSFEGQAPDMEEAVTEYVNSVFMEVDLYQAVLNETFFVEVKFNLHHIDKDMFGTADAVIYNKSYEELIVFDYKHGMGIPVDVENNVQLRYYALGALYKLKVPVKKFTFVIVQPRCDHADGIERRETIDAEEMLKFERWLGYKVKAAKNPEAKLIPGDWCRFCRAMVCCPKIKEQKNAVAKLEFKKHMSFNMQDLVKALNAVPLLKAWISSVDAFAYDQAVRGTKIPGYKLVEKRATRKWQNQKEVEDYVFRSHKNKISRFFSNKLKSPAQFEKVLSPKEMAYLADHIVKESSGIVLVNADDKRQEYLPTSRAEKDFKDLL